MRNWYTENSSWEGTASELAELVKPLLSQMGLTDDSTEPNERLVRHYRQIEILDRPVKSGKEAHFRAKQVIEFLVARKLVKEGWPLAKIAEFTRTHDMGTLLDILPQSREPTEAEKIVAKLRQNHASAPVPTRPSESQRIELVCNGASANFLDYSAERERRKTVSQATLVALGNPHGKPSRAHLVKLGLTPWCELLVDIEELKSQSIDSLDHFGETVTQVLKDELLNHQKALK